MMSGMESSLDLVCERVFGSDLGDDDGGDDAAEQQEGKHPDALVGAGSLEHLLDQRRGAVEHVVDVVQLVVDATQLFGLRLQRLRCLRTHLATNTNAMYQNTRKNMTWRPMETDTFQDMECVETCG